MNNPFDNEANEPITEVETDAHTDDPGVAQFREAFAHTDFHLLEPLHPEVNYSFEVMPAIPTRWNCGLTSGGLVRVGAWKTAP